MHHQPDPSVRDRRGHRDTHEPWLVVGPEAGQAGQPAAIDGGKNRGLVAAGLYRDLGVRRERGEPAGLGRILGILGWRDDLLAGTAIGGVDAHVSIQVARARLQPERDTADPPDDEIVLIGMAQAHRDVRLPHG